MTKRIAPLESSRKNLATQSNFVEFQDSRNFTYFEETGIGRHMASHVSQCMAKACMCETWKAMCVTHGTFEAYIYGVSNSVCGGGGGSKLQSVGAARRRKRKGKEKGGKGEKKGRKGKEKRRYRKERERRKERKKEKEERERKEEKDGVSRNEKIRTAKNSELRYKR